jgi:phosphate-selective porin OprO/OprP
MRIALLLFLFALPLSAQSIEERLTRLEQEMRELRAENAELRRQLGARAQAPTPTSTAAPVPAKASAGESSLTIGGFVQAQAESGGRPDTRYSDDHDRLFLRRARLLTRGRFAEHFDWRYELDLSGSLGNASGLRAQATDAYVAWTRYPLANIRAGQFKSPYGFEQLYSDVALHTPVRTIGSDRLTQGRQLGAQLSGTFANERAGYAVGLFNGNGTNVSFNDNDGFLVAARLTATPWRQGDRRWSVGAGGYASDDRNVPVAPELGFANNSFAGERRAWGVDTQFITPRNELWAELLHAGYDPATGRERDATAFYFLGSHLFTNKLQGVVRYDSLDANGNETTSWIGGINYLLRGNDIKLQLHYLHGDEGRVIARVQTMF